MKITREAYNKTNVNNSDSYNQNSTKIADIEISYDSYHSNKTNKQQALLKKTTRIIKGVFREPIFLVSVSILLFILLFMRAFLVPSGSMKPTLMEGDRIMSIANYFQNGETYKPGDIVCFVAPDGNIYVKRVIGNGGDHIQISGEKIYVNGELSDYQGTAGMVTSLDIWLDDDEYWVMGDNRGNSEDSRYIGPINAKNMVSKVYFIYFPFDRFGFV